MLGVDSLATLFHVYLMVQVLFFYKKYQVDMNSEAKTKSEKS